MQLALKIHILCFSLYLLLGYNSPVIAGETITAREVEGYFYADGKMKRSKGEFEITYYLEGKTITRTRVYDYRKNKIIPDDTVYYIQDQLSSHPKSEEWEWIEPRGPVIRAIGQPGLDAIEILAVGENYIQCVKSTSDYFVISRSKRIK
jgi:hypothetical protein